MTVREAHYALTSLLAGHPALIRELRSFIPPDVLMLSPEPEESAHIPPPPPPPPRPPPPPPPPTTGLSDHLIQKGGPWVDGAWR